jgi:hypothetical protein
MSSDEKRSRDFVNDFNQARGMAPVPKLRSSEYRTLQRYRAGVNIDSAMYMERNSMLTQKDLAVSVSHASYPLQTSKDSLGIPEPFVNSQMESYHS